MDVRPPLLQPDGRRVRDHQPLARLPEAQGLAGALTTSALPAHGLGSVLRLAPTAAVREGGQAGRQSQLEEPEDSVPKLFKVMRNNVEIGQQSGEVSGKTLIDYAFLAYGLPGGNFVQVKIERDHGLQRAAHRPGEHPGRGPGVPPPGRRERPRRRPRSRPDASCARRTARARRTCRSSRLNGKREAGRGGEHELSARPEGLPHDRAARRLPGETHRAGGSRTFRTQIFYTARPKAKRAAERVSALFQLVGDPTDAEAEQRAQILRNGAMLLVIVGQTFSGELTPAPVDRTPPKQPPSVRPRQGRTCSRSCARAAAWKVGFPLQLPTVLEQHLPRSAPRVPYRVYKLDKAKTVRFTFAKSGNEYWGIQETDWNDAPALADKNLRARRSAAVSTTSTYNGLAPAHGRAQCRRRELLGREHAARLDLERDDARDRQGPRTLAARRFAARDARRSSLGVFGAGWVGLVTGACFAELGHDVVIRDVVPEKIEALRRGRRPVPRARRAGAARAEPPSGSRFTLDGGRVAGLRSFSSSCVDTPPTALGRRRPAPRLVGGRRAAGAPERRDARHEEHGAGRHRANGSAADARGARASGYVSNPEFLAEGSAVERLHGTRTGSSIGSSGDERRRRAWPRSTSGFDAPIVRTDVTSAEMIKLAANAFLDDADQRSSTRSRTSARRSAPTSSRSPRAWASTSGSGRSFLRAGDRATAARCFPKDVSFLKLLAGNCGYHFQLLTRRDRGQRAPEAARGREAQEAPRLAARQDASRCSGSRSSRTPTTCARRRRSCSRRGCIAEGAEVRAWDPVVDGASRAATASRSCLGRSTPCAAPTRP